ncbi:MAG: ABC transporter ATP-binding protein [Elusimicrobia bacterium]|nr:ABC transporter ATP-binding protein [Elusimicrobiota bacterium]
MSGINDAPLGRRPLDDKSKRSVSPWAVTKRLLPYFRPHRARLVLALIAMALVAGLTAGSMWILKKVIDEALMAGELSTLANVVVLVVILYFGKAVLSYVHDYVTAFIGQSIVKRIRNEAYANIHTLSLDFYTGTDSARVIARLTNDGQLLQNALTKTPVMIVRDGLTVIALTGFLFYLHWKFALVSFTLLPLSGILIARFGKSLRKSAKLGQAKMADLYTLIQETISGAPVVKAFQRENYEKERFARENEAYFRIYMKNARVESLSSPVMEFIGAIGMGVILWFGGKDVVAGVWTTGAFFAFVGSALSLFQPIKNFSRSNSTIQLALAGAERIFDVTDARPTVRERPGAIALPPFADQIEFDRVSFAYRPDQPVLRDVSLTVRRGEIVALVGPSGSGKTTLSALLLRFYDPTAGSIRVDGRDVRTATFQSLRRQIGLVTQETLLFNDTIRANIGYARAEATEDEIVAAAKAANAWEFIRDKPEGLDTLIGERGLLLSGGQKQRLALARAILKNPPILVLDEATSALDAQSERLVQEAVERLMKNRTVFVIAHRLATVKNASRIVVLEHGQIAEMGNHAELLAKDGIYKRLTELQILEK